MELSKFKVEESTELALFDSTIVDENIFIDIVDKIILSMNSLGISLEGKDVYYQRYANKTSILAIKVSNGEDSDVANFMFNGCDASEFERYMSCDVYLHAEAKSAQTSMKIANMISSDIVDFFNTLEGELVLNGNFDNEFFIRIPLCTKEKKKKENNILQLIKNIFKK